MQYSTTPLYNTLQVQIVAQTNQVGAKYYFPDIPQLRDAKIYAITFVSNGYGITRDVNNVTLVDATDILNCYLTLYSSNKEAVQNLPLSLLRSWGASPVISGNSDGIFTFDNLKVDFSKSFVQFASGTQISATPRSFMFNVYYIK
jgi:hypothetical protein